MARAGVPGDGLVWLMHVRLEAVTPACVTWAAASLVRACSEVGQALELRMEPFPGANVFSRACGTFHEHALWWVQFLQKGIAGRWPVLCPSSVAFIPLDHSHCPKLSECD